MATVGQVTVDVSANTAKLQSGMNKAQQQMKNSVYKMKSSLAVLSGALAAVGGVAGFGIMIKSQIDAADKTAKLASKLSMTTESLSSLQYAAKFSGVEIGGLDAALSAMTRRLTNFARTGGGAAKTALEELGFTQEQIQSYKSADKAFMAIADKLSKLAPGMQKTAIAQDIFSKSAASIIPLLDEGSDGIERFREEAERMGLVISDDFAKSSEALNDNLDVLKSVFDGATQSIAERFTPALLEATRSMQDFFNVKYDLSKGEIKKYIQESMDEIENLKKRQNRYLDASADAIGRRRDALIGSAGKMDSLIVEEERKLKKLKEDLAKINKQENMPTVTITRKTKESKETKTKEEKVLNYDNHIKAYYDYLERQKQLTQDFNENMTYTLAEPYEKLMITREKYLKEYGNNAKARLLTEEWYASELEKLNNSEISNFENLEKQKLKIKKEAQKALEKSKKEEEKANRSWNDGAKDSLDSYLEHAKKTYEQVNNATTRSLYGMEDALVKFVQTGKLDFSNLANSIIADIARMSIHQGIAGIASSGIGTWFSGIFSSAKGNVFNNGAPQQFAKGGLPFGSNLQFAMAGGGVGSMNEQGQEAIMPLTRGAGGVLGVKAIGGGQSAGNTIINIKNETGMPIDMKTISESMNNGDRTVEVVMNAIERNPDMRNAIKGVR